MSMLALTLTFRSSTCPLSSVSERGRPLIQRRFSSNRPGMLTWPTQVHLLKSLKMIKPSASSFKAITRFSNWCARTPTSRVTKQIIMMRERMLVIATVQWQFKTWCSRARPAQPFQMLPQRILVRASKLWHHRWVDVPQPWRPSKPKERQWRTSPPRWFKSHKSRTLLLSW